ncbi:hypothetical protein NVV93_00210 [Pseudomonas sp. LS44]|uniref:hypothetical protein n=1 Tax=Pseudomonas sp. LS44 TaxID=1357074 RepID=UPI00215ABD84|nr:hypothetical protein [Pseudomonas sp. LS44]UVE17860.1 hypothetical protein NVV93_00210 [Pseudomonas sp. LS44]
MEPIVDSVVYVIPPSGSWFADLATLLSAIAALASVIVACIAVRFSHQQIKLHEQHNRRMVTPHLSGWAHTDPSHKTFFFTLENNGLGPAIAREIKFWVDGELQEGEGPDVLEAAAKKYLGAIDSNQRAEMFIVGEFIPPGRKFNTFTLMLREHEPHAIMAELKVRTRLLIRYESILGDSYVYDSDSWRDRQP